MEYIVSENATAIGFVDKDTIRIECFYKSC